MIHLAKPEDIARDTVEVRPGSATGTYDVYFRDADFRACLTPPTGVSAVDAELIAINIRTLVGYCIEAGRTEGELLSG